MTTRAERLEAAIGRYGFAYPGGGDMAACLAILAEAEKEAEGQRDARQLERRMAYAAIIDALGYAADSEVDSETLLRRVRYLDAVERCVLEQSHAVGLSETTADTRTRVVAMRREIERLRKPREEKP